MAAFLGHGRGLLTGQWPSTDTHTHTQQTSGLLCVCVCVGGFSLLRLCDSVYVNAILAG